jgi:ribosomal protein L12E/L44/L45/RPP1/RPP2
MGDLIDGLANWLEGKSIKEIVNKAKDSNGWRSMAANVADKADDDE